MSRERLPEGRSECAVCFGEHLPARVRKSDADDAPVVSGDVAVDQALPLESVRDPRESTRAGQQLRGHLAHLKRAPVGGPEAPEELELQPGQARLRTQAFL